MKYTLTKNKNGEHIAEIKMDAKEWETYLESAYQKTKEKYTVQGFRKGKAPRNVIEKIYGDHVFLQDALDDAFYKTYTQILTENTDVKPVTSPDLDIKSYDDKGIVLSMKISCLPDFDMPQYKGLTFHKHLHPVTDAMFDENLQRELMRASKLVESNSQIANDDYATLDFEGFIDGKPFEGGKAQDYQLKIGSHSFIDTFEEQLIGLNVGDEKDVNVTFPQDYHEKKYAGKPALFKVKIKKIRVRQMPELNEEFVKDVSEFNTVDEFKANIKRELEEKVSQEAQANLENNIIDSIVESAKIDLPKAMLESEQKRLMNGFENQLAQQGIKIDDYAKYMGKSVSDLLAEQEEYAVRSLKSRIILEHIIQLEKIDVSEEQIKAKMEEIAKMQNVTVQDIEKQLNEDIKNRLISNILMDNIVKFLVENNTIELCNGHD